MYIVLIMGAAVGHLLTEEQTILLDFEEILQTGIFLDEVRMNRFKDLARDIIQ